MTNRRSPARACKDCGAPSDQRAYCAICDPHKRTSGHRDKYADKKVPA
jgi:hypothetical protein